MISTSIRISDYFYGVYGVPFGVGFFFGLVLGIRDPGVVVCYPCSTRGRGCGIRRIRVHRLKKKKIKHLDGKKTQKKVHIYILYDTCITPDTFRVAERNDGKC